MAESQHIRWRGDAQPLCPNCDGVELRRQGRVGIWQRVVLPWMGLYPWECGLCRRIYTLRQRSSGYTAASQLMSAVDQNSRQTSSVGEAAKKLGAAGEDQATGTAGFSTRHRSH
jgi:ribosomal protein L37AE/L43A